MVIITIPVAVLLELAQHFEGKRAEDSLSAAAREVLHENPEWLEGFRAYHAGKLSFNALDEAAKEAVSSLVHESKHRHG